MEHEGVGPAHKEPASKGKDGWDKASIILGPVGGLLTALAIAGLGFFGSQYLDRRQNIETNVRLFSELMSRREEAESALRKDMFVSIIQSFLKPESASLEEKVLNLELLTYNFHESLNLRPLFAHLKKQVIQSKHVDKQEYLDRLDRVAREITRKQMLVLEGAGKRADFSVDLERFRENPGGIDLEDVSLTVEEIERNFKIYVLKADPATKELNVRLEIRTPLQSGETVDAKVAEFWVSFFDFPMIDNTRLSNDQRCAIVLTAFGSASADITIVYFPGAYASLKEKPYYQEMVQNLLKTSELFGQVGKK